MKIAPDYQTQKFELYTRPWGSSLMRTKDRRAVYFSVKDVEYVKSNVPDMTSGEGAKVFDQWAAPYFGRAS